jgi:hypothetical protein
MIAPLFNGMNRLIMMMMNGAWYDPIEGILARLSLGRDDIYIRIKPRRLICIL